MPRRGLFFVALLLCELAAVPGAAAQSGARKKRVAVLNFEYATVQSSVAAIFGTNVDIGRGIAELLVDRLVSDGTYTVVERKAIDRVIAEQNFSNSDRADSATAAKLGRVLGVDAIIIGSITQFGRDDKSTNVGGSVLGGIRTKYGLGGVGLKESKAVVGINARMVSADTAEVLTVGKGIGESARKGTSLLGAGGSASGAGAGAYDMRSSNFANTILGEAVGKAVTQVAQELEASSTKLPEKVVLVEGLVADATGSQLVLNVGSRAGLRVGDKLDVRRGGKEIKDPATGKVLRRMETALGQVTITEVDDQSAVGTYSGNAPAKVGDIVKTSKQ